MATKIMHPAHASRVARRALDADAAEELFTKVDETNLTRNAQPRACSQTGVELVGSGR